MSPLIIAADEPSQRNAATVLALYKEMINQRQAGPAVEKYLDPNYIQHNPILPTSAQGLAAFFTQVTQERVNPRVVIHRLIASGDYLWAHVNFRGVFNDDPADRGVAGVDIYKFDAAGKIIEHWDVLQPVPDPATAANTNGMF